MIIATLLTVVVAITLRLCRKSENRLVRSSNQKEGALS